MRPFNSINNSVRSLFAHTLQFCERSKHATATKIKQKPLEIVFRLVRVLRINAFLLGNWVHQMLDQSVSNSKYAGSIRNYMGEHLIY